MDFDLLRPLEPELRRALLARARRRRFARGEVIFHAGDPASSLHLLVAGRVAVRVLTPAGDTATLTVLGLGAAFGELALVGEGVRTATVVATEAVETLSLATEQFEALRRGHPQVDRFLVTLLAGYVRRLDQQLLEALYVPAERRVLRRVLTLSRVYGDGRAGTVIPVTQDTLASMAGSTRPTANQALRAAEAAGLLAVDRGRVTVLDPAGLARKAG